MSDQEKQNPVSVRDQSGEIPLPEVRPSADVEPRSDGSSDELEFDTAEEPTFWDFDPGETEEYSINRLIGRGGFGEVYEAFQHSLSRTVAIKRVRDDIYQSAGPDPGAVRYIDSAFRKEALILAKLEHPNIVPIHDLALGEDGRPILAMKLVRGRPWDLLIRRDFHLPTAEFLQRHLQILIAVAQAAAFAHSRGVIHRDIKPSQIMVGEFGEVQLMDWGVAVSNEEINYIRSQERLEQEDATAVKGPGPAGTSAFMAPEQTEPSIANIGPWTDVFLLGGCLYFLLTGRTPYGSKDSGLAFKLACQHQLIPPRDKSPNRDIPTELEEICMRAMARIVEDRYASAEELISDLQDYLSGVSRKREAIQLTGVVAERLLEENLEYRALDDCHAMLDRAQSLWPEGSQVQPLRNDVAQQYANRALANEDLVLARLQAERMTPCGQRQEIIEIVDRMEEKKERDAQRLEQAVFQLKDLVNFVLEDMHNGLESIGRLDLLGKVSEKMLGFFESFPEEQFGEGALRGRMLTLLRLSNVMNAGGRRLEAERALEAAREICERMAERHPDIPEWRKHLAEIFEAFGESCYTRGDLDHCVDWQERARLLRQELADQSGADEDRAAVAKSCQKLASAWWRKGNQKKALECECVAMGYVEALLSAHPQHPTYRAMMASSNVSLGWIARAVGDNDEAISRFEEALRIRERLCEEDPNSLSRLADLAWTLRAQALIFEDALRFSEGMAALKESLRISHRLTEADPANLRHRSEEGFAYGAMARIHQFRRQWVKAETVFWQAIDIQKRLVEKDPANARLSREYCYNLIGLATLAWERGNPASAREQAEHALEVIRRMIHQLEHENPSLREVEGRAKVALGQADLAEGRLDSARAHFEEAIRILEPAIKGGDFPAVQEEPVALAFLYLDRVEDAWPYVQRLNRKRWKGRIFTDLLAAKGLV